LEWHKAIPMAPKGETGQLRPAESARAVARKMLEAIGVFGGSNAAEQFVDGYAARFRRPGLKAHTVQFHDLLDTIGREALLAMTAQMYRELPRIFTRGKSDLLRGAAADAADAFREAFFTFLGGAMDWGPAERDAFRRDLELYLQLDPGEARAGRPRRRTESVQGPFVDRCGLLLDPSLLDKARQAAAKFLTELEALTDRFLAETFGGSTVE
jgi:hypothetical protein